MIAFSATRTHFLLDAITLFLKAINSDQFSEAQSLILAIHKVLTVEGTP
jgi:hypothetical protein